MQPITDTLVNVCFFTVHFSFIILHIFNYFLAFSALHISCFNFSFFIIHYAVFIFKSLLFICGIVVWGPTPVQQASPKRARTEATLSHTIATASAAADPVFKLKKIYKNPSKVWRFRFKMTVGWRPHEKRLKCLIEMPFWPSRLNRAVLSDCKKTPKTPL